MLIAILLMAAAFSIFGFATKIFLAGVRLSLRLLVAGILTSMIAIPLLLIM